LTRPGKSTNLGAKSSKGGDDTWENNEAVERKAGKKDLRDFNRTSKHAPTEMSSKKAVSRKREVVPVTKREYRDPRFEPLVGHADEAKVRKAYSFLDDYREDEMKELRNAIKTTKDDEAKEKLKRALLSMESRKKAQLRKDKEKEVLDRHRKEEKELVKQGKKPFYLKKSEQKKRVLLDQYGSLKGKQLDRVIERRRKKVEGKEKKKMPFARRDVTS
jgi:ribosomal RNA-processing protein 36